MARRKLPPGIHLVNVKGRRRKVKVLANGQWRFMKMSGTTKKRATSNPRSSKKKARKVRRKMAKKKRRRRSMTIPLAPIIGLIASPAINKSITGVLAGDLQAPMRWLPNLVGVWADGSFHMDTLMANMTPIAAGLLVHKFIGGWPLNLNRTLGAARVPFLRI